MKKKRKQVTGFIGTGIMLGVGTSAVSEAGGETGGLEKMSGMMPVAGTMMGAGMVLESMKGLTKKKKQSW